MRVITDETLNGARRLYELLSQAYLTSSYLFQLSSGLEEEAEVHIWSSAL